jgi:AraC-like DNA-binding protein/ligand-binding sensor protein
MENKPMIRPALEIILKDDVQALLDSFSACFGIRILFCSPAGEILRFGRSRPKNSRYCSMVQRTLFGVSTCLELDAAKRVEAAEKRKMICYRCHAGLHEAVMPIYAREYLLGFVMIGQFRTTPRIPSEVRAAWAETAPVNRLRDAYAQLPMIPRNRTDDMLRLFSTLVEYIVSRNMVTLKGNLLIEEILEYLNGRTDRPVSLAEAAKVVHRSRSTVSHLFSKTLGKSFKQVLIETKLDKAEEYMRTIPGLTVKETARMIGYDDPFHFSSLY